MCKDYYEIFKAAQAKRERVSEKALESEGPWQERRKVRGPENAQTGPYVHPSIEQTTQDTLARFVQASNCFEESTYVTGQREESTYEESRIYPLSPKSGPVTRTFEPEYEYAGPYQLCCVLGYTVTITFLHYRPLEITVALVEFESSDGSVYLSATEAVSRYYLDEPDDHLARKYALRKALKRLRPAKELRQTAWLAFYTSELVPLNWEN